VGHLWSWSHRMHRWVELNIWALGCRVVIDVGRTHESIRVNRLEHFGVFIIQIFWIRRPAINGYFYFLYRHILIFKPKVLWYPSSSPTFHHNFIRLVHSPFWLINTHPLFFHLRVTRVFLYFHHALHRLLIFFFRLFVLLLAQTWRFFLELILVNKPLFQMCKVLFILIQSLYWVIALKSRGRFRNL
jgi:hypothetical protein